jgi:hypothetical protein
LYGQGFWKDREHMIQFNCPKCGHPYKLRDELAGRTARCAKCRETMKVPSPEILVPAGDRENLDSMLSLLGQAEQASQATEPMRRIPRAPAPAPLPMATPAPQTRTAPRRQRSHSSDFDLGLIGCIIGAALGAGVGAAIWIGIGYATLYEVGYIAVLVGVLAGLGGVGLGREQSPSVGIICALAGLAGVIGGSYGNYYIMFETPAGKTKLLKECEKELAKYPEAASASPEKKKELFDEVFKKLPKTYGEYITTDFESVGLLALFGILGMVTGWRYGTGKNSEET